MRFAREIPCGCDMRFAREMSCGRDMPRKRGARYPAGAIRLRRGKTQKNRGAAKGAAVNGE